MKFQIIYLLSGTVSLKPAKKDERKLVRDMKMFNKEHFSRDVNALNQKTKTCLLTHFRKTFLINFSLIVNKHAALQTQTRKEAQISSKPWVSKGILKSIKSKKCNV